MIFAWLNSLYSSLLFSHPHPTPFPFYFTAVAGPSGSSSVSKGTKSSTASANGTASKRSIQNMEKSEAFKSLFTTHSSAKRTKEQTSNWVTHTPYHF